MPELEEAFWWLYMADMGLEEDGCCEMDGRIRAPPYCDDCEY